MLKKDWIYVQSVSQNYHIVLETILGAVRRQKATCSNMTKALRHT